MSVSTDGEVDGQMLSIGALAERAGVSTRTIRYYEEMEVLPPPPRSPAGTRMYPKVYAIYLEAISVLKDIGFNLDEIKLLERVRNGSATKTEEKQLAKLVQSKLGALEHKIKVMYWLHGIVAKGAGKPITLADQLVAISLEDHD